jgi:hypothetical protein
LGLGETGPARVTLTDNQNLNGLKYVLRSGSRLVLKVEDPMSALPRSSFLPGIVVGTGAYYRANYDTDRLAYTVLMPRGVAGRIFLDTLLLAQDADGNSLPINTPTLPFRVLGSNGTENRYKLLQATSSRASDGLRRGATLLFEPHPERRRRTVQTG